MRPRAGTTLMLSTVANTAFSSATGREATVRVSAPAEAAPQRRDRDESSTSSMPASVSPSSSTTAAWRRICRLMEFTAWYIDLPQGIAHSRAHSLRFVFAAFGGAQ